MSNKSNLYQELQERAWINQFKYQSKLSAYSALTGIALGIVLFLINN